MVFPIKSPFLMLNSALSHIFDSHLLQRRGPLCLDCVDACGQEGIGVAQQLYHVGNMANYCTQWEYHGNMRTYFGKYHSNYNCSHDVVQIIYIYIHTYIIYTYIL